MARELIDYIPSLGRMIRAAGRRVGELGDEPELAELIALRDTVDESIQTAVNGWQERGESWATIGRAAGVTKQTAHERWGQKERATA